MISLLGKFKKVNSKQKLVIAGIIGAVAIPILLTGCSASDAWTEPVYLQTLYVWDGAAWNQITTDGGGGGVPAGADTNVQYNDAGAFGGEAAFTYNDATNALYVQGDITTDNDIWGGNDIHVANDLFVTDDTDIDGNLDVFGTINGINILAHAARHAVGGADAVFPADPGADKFLMWDDTAGTLSWEDAGGGSVGGLYGINVETLAGDKTLTPGTDEIYQRLDPNGSDRIITLATVGATAGDRFVITNIDSYTDTRYLDIRQGGTTLDIVYSGMVKSFIFDGTNWVSNENGTAENDNRKYNTGIGYAARAYDKGTSVGYDTTSYGSGVAVGKSAQAGGSSSVAVGSSTSAYGRGVAIGYYAQTIEYYGTAIGSNSKATRAGEFARNIGSDSDQENNITQGGWAGDIAAGASGEIYCASFSTSRFTIRAKSALSFELQVVARDNTADEVARYSFEGLIKRDGSNNTTLVWSTGGADYEDDAAWDCTIAADDTNEALIITCTGDGSNTTQWAAVLDGVETHF